MVPEEIIYTYVALLNNYKKVAKAIENYYTDPNGFGRAKLVQEVARPQIGTMSERILKANKVVDNILNTYNSICPIEDEEIEVDIDLGDEIEKIMIRTHSGLITWPKPCSIKRVK